MENKEITNEYLRELLATLTHFIPKYETDLLADTTEVVVKLREGQYYFSGFLATDNSAQKAEIRFLKTQIKELSDLLFIRDNQIARMIVADQVLLNACEQMVMWCDKNPPAGEALYFVQLARDAVERKW